MILIKNQNWSTSQTTCICLIDNLCTYIYFILIDSGASGLPLRRATELLVVSEMGNTTTTITVIFPRLVDCVDDSEILRQIVLDSGFNELILQLQTAISIVLYIN